MATEKTGIRFENEGYSRSIKEIDGFDKAYKRLTDNLNKTTGTLKTSARRGFDSFSDGLDTALTKFNEITPFASDLEKHFRSIGATALKNVPGLNTFVSSISSTGTAAMSTQAAVGASIAAIGATVAVATAGTIAILGLSKAFYELGTRGAQVQITGQAFGNFVSIAGDSTSVLQGLRNATRGTVSDFELMQLTTKILTGTEAKFRNELLKTEDGQVRLGKVIDQTNRIAVATGADAEYIREKFLTGLRLSSKLRVDDAIGTFDQAKANEEYAKSINKTVAELTAEEKQLAFTAGALKQLDKVASELGAPNKIIENLSKPGVLLRNTIDQLAVAVVPVFEPIAIAIGSITEKLAYLGSFIMPIVGSGFKVLGTVISTAFSIFGTIYNATLRPAFSFLFSGLPYVAALAQIAADAFARLGQTIANSFASSVQLLGNIASGVVGQFTGVFGGLTGQVEFSLNNLAMALANGGGRVIGSFAVGMANGAKAVVKVVTFIAQLVADFLQGFSPPKKGPLSEIDKGGENVLSAWLDGFSGGLDNSIEAVAARVESRLGDIGNFSAGQVASRFSALDTALQPFVDQLDIARADFEAIAGGADKALEAIQRQQSALGTVDTKEEVDKARLLDKQAAIIKQTRDSQQSLVDNAEIGLAIQKASQAQERALLAIQQRRVGTVKDIATGGAGAAEKASAAEKAGAGGSPTEGAAGAGLPGGGKAPNLLTNPAIDAARQQITQFANNLGTEFSEGFNDATAESFGELDLARGDLDAQLARIRGADPIGKLKEKFSGLETIADIFTAPFESAYNKFEEYFGESGKITSVIKGFVDSGPLSGAGTFITNLTGTFSGGGAVDTALVSGENRFSQFSANAQTSLRTLATSAGAILGTSLTAVFGEGGLLTTLTQTGLNKFNELATNSGTYIDQIKTKLNNTFAGLTAEDGVFGSGGIFAQGISAVFGEEGFFTLAMNSIITKLNTLATDIEIPLNAIGDKFKSIFSDPAGAVQTAKQSMFDVITAITESLKNFAGESGVGAALAAFGQTISGATVTPFAEVMNTVLELAESAINNAITNANKLLKLIGKELDTVDLGRVTVPGAARGANRISGDFIAGEKGPELISTKRPRSVFPASVTRQMEHLSRVVPLPPTQNSTVHNSKTANLGGVTILVNNAEDVGLVQRQLLAGLL